VSETPVADPVQRTGAKPSVPFVAEVRLRWLDPVIRVVGLLVAVGLSGVLALYEVFMSPLRWHGGRLPLALVLAIGGNLVLIWFTRLVTGRAILVAVPAVVWVALMIFASQRTAEGDLLLTDNNWVGLATLLAGSLVYAFGGYWLITHTAPTAGYRQSPPT
jgi:hypothetical protein